MFLEKPSINLLSIKDVTARRGEDIKVMVPFSANPLPTMEWKVLRQNSNGLAVAFPKNKRFSIVEGDLGSAGTRAKRRRHSISQLEGKTLKRQTSCTFEPGREFETLESEDRVCLGVSWLLSFQCFCSLFVLKSCSSSITCCVMRYDIFRFRMVMQSWLLKRQASMTQVFTS